MTASHQASGGTPWQRNRALTLVAARVPGIATALPPKRAQLQGVLTSLGATYRLAEPREVEESYEATVATGRIPCRDASWHDVFNVGAFLIFPRAKAALHGRVLSLQRQRKLSGERVRTREEDALTILDEAVIVVSGRDEPVRRFEELHAAGDLDRIDDLMREASLFMACFGHALLEHLVLQRRRIRAGVLPIVLSDEVPVTLAATDEALARHIAAGRLERPRFGRGLPWPDDRDRVQSWLSELA